MSTTRTTKPANLRVWMDPEAPSRYGAVAKEWKERLAWPPEAHAMHNIVGYVVDACKERGLEPCGELRCDPLVGGDWPTALFHTHVPWLSWTAPR